MMLSCFSRQRTHNDPPGNPNPQLPNQPPPEFKGQYNAANQRIAVIEEDGRQWAFDYDSLGQVIQAEKRLTESEEVLPGYAFAYSFDDIGNRIHIID